MLPLTDSRWRYDDGGTSISSAPTLEQLKAIGRRQALHTSLHPTVQAYLSGSDNRLETALNSFRAQAQSYRTQFQVEGPQLAWSLPVSTADAAFGAAAKSDVRRPRRRKRRSVSTAVNQSATGMSMIREELPHPARYPSPPRRASSLSLRPSSPRASSPRPISPTRSTYTAATTKQKRGRKPSQGHGRSPPNRRSSLHRGQPGRGSHPNGGQEPFPPTEC